MEHAKNRLRATALGAAAGVVVAALAVSGAHLPVQAAPVVNGTLTFAPPSGAPGTALTISGAIKPRVRHQVKLQRWEPADGFITLAIRRTDNQGGFAFRTRLPQDRVTASYRVLSPRTLDPATGTKKSYVSATGHVSITGIVRISPAGEGYTYDPAIAANGRFIAYVGSGPSGSAPRGIFVWERHAGVTSRVPRSGTSYRPAISGDGRFIVFDSIDPEGVFIWDSRSRTRRRIGLGEFPAISGDGRYVAYNGAGLEVWDRVTGQVTHVGSRDNSVGTPSFSADGRYVAFSSSANDLVPDDTNGSADVFVWDLTTGTTTRVVAGNGDSGCVNISGDGRFIAFCSDASDLAPTDTNGKTDVFLWDSASGTTTPLTHGDHDSSASSISADGRYVTIDSRATNLLAGPPTRGPEVYVWDRTTGATARLTDGNRVSFASQLSGDGRAIVFDSCASDLIPHDSNDSCDVFLWTTSAVPTDSPPHA